MEIRIFSLYPSASFHAELHGQLEIKSQTAVDARYEAISYTWGVESAPEDLVLNGQHFHIGLNLRDALRRLRLPRRSRRLWIDAVCINQDDNDEKTAQIAVMGAIYSKARRTIIWLGEDSADTDGKVAIQFFAKAAQRIWYRQRIDGLESEPAF